MQIERVDQIAQEIIERLYIMDGILQTRVNAAATQTERKIGERQLAPIKEQYEGIIDNIDKLLNRMRFTMRGQRYQYY